jgi:hypothetical protein
MKEYLETQDSTYRYGEMIIPSTLSNRHYREMVEEVNRGAAIVVPYIPTKTLEELQQEALTAINGLVSAECRSGVGKLYFSDLNSAARHTSDLVQPDAEVRARAITLLKWDVLIDAYCDAELFKVQQGGEVPTLEVFLSNLPTIEEVV